MGRTKIAFKGGQTAETMSLVQLRDRLTEIIESNKSRGWAHRNNNPVVVKIDQGKTPTGRLRDPHYYALPFVDACSCGIIGLAKPDGAPYDYGTTELLAGEFLAEPSRKT